MSLFPAAGAAVCCREDAGYWHCQCPKCARINLLNARWVERAEKQAKPDTVSVPLSRRQFQLIHEILEVYEVDCARRKLKKSEASPEWMALQFLETDVEAIVRKLREALGR